MSNNHIKCLISDSRSCKASSQSDLVFIIGSGSDEFTPEINLIQAVLEGFDFSAEFALLSDKSKGLDAFCDKICSKIRESQFCIVLLNDPRSLQYDTLRVPSANVYYEFGLAVAQGRKVIPIIRRGFMLPFDVQHLDAIIYDNLDDLKAKLKKSVKGTLRNQRQTINMENGSQEFQSKIYGPLYNEIDGFIIRKNLFTTFEDLKYEEIQFEYKYLLDKTDQTFQKNLRRFYQKIQQFNTQLPVAQKAIKQIVETESNAFFNYTGDAKSWVRVEISGETGNRVLPRLEELLLWKIKPQDYFNTVQQYGEKVIGTKYRYERSGLADRILSSEESSELFKVCYTKVESDATVSILRKSEKQLQRMAKKLREHLRQMC